MGRRWQADRADAAAAQLYRGATVLMSIVVVLALIAIVVGVSVAVLGSAVPGTVIAAAGVISIVPTVVLGLAAQAYSWDVRNRLARDDERDTAATGPAAPSAEVIEDGGGYEPVRRRPRAGRPLAGH